MQARKVAKLKAAADTDAFKEAALEWYGKHHERWSEQYAIREKRNLEKDLFPYFATRSIGDIQASFPRGTDWGQLEWTTIRALGSS